jgi:dTMP kinase
MSKYVIIDGMDGSGKGTQMALLRRVFPPTTVFTREPGGTPFAEEIRSMLLDTSRCGSSSPLNNFLLFWAAREEHLFKLVAPSLAEGKHVVSDRGDSSTFAFQIHGEQHMDLLPLFAILRETIFHGRRKPDLYIIFDLPAEVARERATRDTKGEKNHFDERYLEYYERVRRGFQNFASQAPVALIDASRSPEEVHTSVLEQLAKLGIT